MTKLESNLSIGAKLDAGHFGEVFLATDDVQGEVAAKILKQQAGESLADWQARKSGLLAEGQRLQKAQHKNVVQVFQALQSGSDDAIHLVMEYCSGGSLQKAFEKGPMTLKQVRKVATEVSLGLDALHARGMLHRDIKPGNILVDSRGVHKVGDFGLVTDNLVLGYASQAGYLDHVAPEVHLGTTGTSVRSDIWAFGMTLYRLLHGQDWYARSPSPKLLVASGGFAQKLSWLPHIPDKWRRLIRKMMHDDTSARYQSMTQILSALASLPIEPSWKCSVTPTHIQWRRKTETRKIIVDWKASGSQFEWTARSKPLGSGNRRTLGGSTQLQTAKLSIKQLEEFFAKSA